MGKFLFLLVFIIALVTIMPFFTIWSLNTLFDTGIPVTFGTWISAVWIHILIGGSKVSSKRS